MGRVFGPRLKPSSRLNRAKAWKYVLDGYYSHVNAINWQPADFQIIVGEDGKPAFAVVPFAQFRCMKGRLNQGTVPNEVVNLSFDRNVSAMAAWREHLGLTQAEVARRIGITQAAYAQMERVKQPRKATLEKVAAALDLEVEQLRW